MADTSLPPCRILARSKTRIELFEADRRRILLDNASTTIQAASVDGVFVHVVDVGIVKLNIDDTSVDDKNSSTPLKAYFEGTRGVQMMDLSSNATFLITWERYNADSCPLNMKVWQVSTGAYVCGFLQKSLSREGWPYLQFGHDEQYAFWNANNSQVRVYKTVDMMDTATTATEPRFIEKIQTPCSTLSVAKHANSGGLYNFTTFAGKTKDKPAAATVYQYNSKTNQVTKLASKSLFQAEECTTYWNATGTGCLLTLATAVDTTGSSYYGSSQLYLWNTEKQDAIIGVTLPQEGPVQSVAWLPNPEKPPSFVVLAGKMPSMGSFHHGKTGDVTFLFGNNVHRNTISISPHARFLVLAGFGNLAGGMGFWDINKKKLLPHSLENLHGTLRAEAVTMFSWAPDSRSFLVATTAPRMNVDNGIRLFKYTGEEIKSVPWKNADYQPNGLLEACFIPSNFSYPDRPQSPAPEPSPENAIAPIKEAPKPAANKYVPPSARKQGGSSLAERMRREKEGKVQGATIVTKQNNPILAKKVPVGMSAVHVSGGKSKSQIKREKLKKKKEEEMQQEQSAEASTPPAVADPSGEAIDPEKRARKLKKILKQIEELKLRDCCDLNEDQKAKIASEAQIRAELTDLKG